LIWGISASRRRAVADMLQYSAVRVECVIRPFCGAGGLAGVVYRFWVVPNPEIVSDPFNPQICVNERAKSFLFSKIDSFRAKSILFNAKPIAMISDLPRPQINAVVFRGRHICVCKIVVWFFFRKHSAFFSIAVD
jgi:hypothetical protein